MSYYHLKNSVDSFSARMLFLKFLLRYMLQRYPQYHQSHLYQLLNQAGQSHARVSTIHFTIALAQGGGAYVMLQLSALHQWGVFLPYLVFEVFYALFVLRTARRCGVLDRTGSESL